MSEDRQLIALRKELLVARGSLQRLKVAREIDTLRGSVSWPRAMSAFASSPPGRSLLFGVALFALGPGRLGRAVRYAAAALALAKLALALRSPSPLGEGRGEGRLSPSPLGEGRGEGRISPSPLGEGRGEGRLSPSPLGEGRGEGRISPSPLGEGRGEGRGEG